MRATYIAVRRLLVFLVGASVVLAGIVMIVTPGPAFIVIPAGLALLATEFVWARRLLARLKRSIDDGIDRARGGRSRPPSRGGEPGRDPGGDRGAGR